MDQETGQPTGPPVVLSSSIVYSPRWSPASGQIVGYLSTDRVVTVDALTGALVGDLASGRDPDWSPNLP